MKTVILIDDQDSGEGRQSIVLGTFEAPDEGAVRELLNLAENVESDCNIKITFEKWTDAQIRKSEIAGSIWAGDGVTKEERAEWLALGGDPAVLPDEDLEEAESQP